MRAAFTQKGGFFMFAGLSWQWWLAILILLVLSIPLKIRFLKWWGEQRDSRRKKEQGKWGDEE